MKMRYGQLEQSFPMVQLKIAELTGFWMCLNKVGRPLEVGGIKMVRINSDHDYEITIQDAMMNEIHKWFFPEFADLVFNDILENKF